MATVRWKAETAGGVGQRSFEFRVHDGRVENSVQSSPSPVWDWKPAEPGTYRVKVVVRDSVGNTVDGGWSPRYEVVPKLVVSSLSPDNPSPQPALVSSIRWTADVQGGVRDRTYTFWKTDGKEEIVQSGASSTWEWSPGRTGIYRVKVVVKDSIGNAVDSGWSPNYEIVPPLGGKSLLAVMPMENLAGAAVPHREIMESIRATLKSKGINILEEDSLDRFLEKHRVRHVGGLTRELGEVFLEETGANAALFLSLDQYDETDPPKIALSARLVSTGRKTIILWADGVALAGNDAPGILGLNLIHDSRMLWIKAAERVASSLEKFLAGRETWNDRDGRAGSVSTIEKRGKFRPKDFFLAPREPAVKREAMKIAVLPFSNESTRRNAGELIALHFLRHLSARDGFEVIEPGIVRQALLTSRTIMEGGLSLSQADLLRVILEVELVLLGNVFEYEDYKGPLGSPKVNFSVLVYDTKTRLVTWSSISHNRGDDGVFFFNMGKVHTAHAMASSMARAVVERMAPP